jgi:hypothetical protein
MVLYNFVIVYSELDLSLEIFLSTLQKVWKIHW